MELKDFYKFSPRGYMTQFYAPCPILLTERYKGISAFELLYGKYDNFDFPIIFQQRKSYGGQKITDFLNTGWGGLLTPISDKVLNLLIENNITGWKTYPIRVFDKKGNEIEGYHGFSITGRCKDLDLTLVKERVEYQYRESGPIYHHIKGFPLDISTWDSSDIFILSGTGYSFMSKKVYSIFKKAKVSNIEYIKVSEYVIMGEDIEESLINKKFKKDESYNW